MVSQDKQGHDLHKHAKIQQTRTIGTQKGENIDDEIAVKRCKQMDKEGKG
jgi:hypothetical protein